MGPLILLSKQGLGYRRLRGHLREGEGDRSREELRNHLLPPLPPFLFFSHIPTLPQLLQAAFKSLLYGMETSGLSSILKTFHKSN